VFYIILEMTQFLCLTPSGFKNTTRMTKNEQLQKTRGSFNCFSLGTIISLMVSTSWQHNRLQISRCQSRHSH